MKPRHKRKLQKALAAALSLCLAVGTFGGIPVSAQEEVAPQETPQLSEERWTPDEAEQARLQSTAGDMSLAELATAVLPEADKPELVSEAAIAEKGHVNRLHEQETDLNTVIFQNRDGTKTLYYFAQPVKYVDETGQVRDKNNCLVKVTDPLYAADYGYVNGSNDIQTYFPKSLNTDSGLLLRNENTAIELQPLSSFGALETTMPAGDHAMAQADYEQTQQVLNTVELPAKAAAADLLTPETIQYRQVFGEHTALQYTPTYSGFKEDIILTQYNGVNEFTFRLKTNGLTMAREDGQYYLADPLTGERVINIGDLFVYDSRDAGLSSDEADTTLENEEKQASAAREELESTAVIVPEDSAEPVYDHHYVVETVVADEEYRITVVVDEDYLRAPDTVYPVIVDPSFSFNKAASAIQDAILYNGASARNTAHGSNWDHYIGYYNSTYGVGRLLVKFPGLTNSALFKSLDASQISSASFNVWQYRVSTAPTSIRAYLYNGSAWTESTIRCTTASWNSYSSLSGMGNVSVTSRAWYSFNIKPAVLKWKDGTHDAAKGLMIRNLNESNSGCYKVFNSTEWGSSQNSSQMPYVTLSWNANTPSGITNNSVYYFQNVCSGKYLDIQNNGTSNNTPTIQNSLSYAPSQRFKLVRDGSGYYRIHAQNTTAKRVLLLNTSNQVVLSDDCTNDRALWRIKDEGDGCYSFINKANESTSAYAMSNMGSNSSGAQVKGETYTNATRLRWRLKPAVSSIVLSASSLSLNVGETKSVSATVYPTNALNKTVAWSSSDSNIATVDSYGKITAVGAGTATITVRSLNDNTKYDTCIVLVKSPDPFHPSNIEYVKTVIIPDVDGDWTALTTKSSLSEDVYFSAFDDNGHQCSVLVSSLLIHNLTGYELNYQEFANPDQAPNELQLYHKAKTFSDDAVSQGVISYGSAEYYGMWACNASDLLDAYYFWMGEINKATEAFELFTTFVSIYANAFYSSAARTYTGLQYQSITQNYTSFSSLTDAQAINEGITDTVTFGGPRRTWRASEMRLAEEYQTSSGYVYNKSYKSVNGVLTEVPYGTAGSQRPDFYNPSTNHIVEVKNYNITTSSGRNNLANNIASQYNKRKSLFSGAQIDIKVDVFGQAYTQDMLDDICNRVQNLLGDSSMVKFIYD